MSWLKRNLFLVVGGLVALGLLGFAGYYLWTKIQSETDVTAQLEGQKSELQSFKDLDPHPGTEKVNNLEAARKQEKQLQEFIAESRKLFVPMDYPKGLDAGQFRLLLESTVDELTRNAERSGVKLQSGYGFTFAGQRTDLAIDSNILEPLAAALMDIRAISTILIQSKVLAIDGIRRVAIATKDTPSPSGLSDFWSKKPSTNDLAITVPYEFSFHCFAPELAAVLEGIYRDPHGFVVKNVIVDTAASQLLEVNKDQAAPMSMPAGAPGGMDMRMMMRYGLMNRYAQPPPQAATAAPTAKPGLQPMLDEKPFRVVLYVEAVRLKTGEEAKQGGGNKRRPRAAAQGDSTTENPGN